MNLYKQSIILVVLFQLTFSSRIAKCDVDIEIINYITKLDDPIQVTCTDKFEKGQMYEATLNFEESLKFECKKYPKTQVAECNCEVKWGDQEGHFYAYKSERDNAMCKNNCRWYVSQEGPKLADNFSSRENPTYKVQYAWGAA